MDRMTAFYLRVAVGMWQSSVIAITKQYAFYGQFTSYKGSVPSLEEEISVYGCDKKIQMGDDCFLFVDFVISLSVWEGTSEGHDK